jgi:serine protease Do
MGRAATPLAMIGMLGLGIGLGLAIGRAPSVVSARQGGSPPAATSRPEIEDGPRSIGTEAIHDELDRQYARFRDIDRTFALVAKAVAPAVVHIVARKRGPGRHDDRVSDQPFEESGSGVIVRPDSETGRYVLTNHHVVEGARPEDVEITLHDGRAIRPERFWTDRKADVAVLRLGRDDLPWARLGDSDTATVGSWVLALGSPFGLSQSVSQGIISARNRHEEELEDDGVENQEFLQTDAAINPGNSGGPLVNMRGEVIGINTAIASNGGGSEGVGFSIPSNLARWIMGQLVARGKVSRGALGVRLQDLDARAAVQRGLERPRGACILHVQENTPAARAGLRDGDVVLRFNGTEVYNINHLINLVSQSPIGHDAELELWRDKQRVSVRVPIADQDEILGLTPPARTLPRPNAPLRRSPRPAPPVPADGASR